MREAGDFMTTRDPHTSLVSPAVYNVETHLKVLIKKRKPFV